jgi:hypothetical protein
MKKEGIISSASNNTTIFENSENFKIPAVESQPQNHFWGKHTNKPVSKRRTTTMISTVSCHLEDVRPNQKTGLQIVNDREHGIRVQKQNVLLQRANSRQRVSRLRLIDALPSSQASSSNINNQSSSGIQNECEQRPHWP